MPFIVETGSGLVNSTAYITVEFADDWHSQKGRASWADLSITLKEEAITKATFYIDSRFDFVGYEPSREQALLWPRTAAYDKNNRALLLVPREIQRACAEYAYQTISGELYNTPSVDDTGGFITKKKEGVGPLTEEFQYSENRGITTIKPIPEADTWLRFITKSKYNELLRM